MIPESLLWTCFTASMKPIAAAIDILTDKEPRPVGHETFIRPLWKQAIGPTVRCIAGDATGIVTGVITAGLGSPMWVDLIVEYVAGFGLFVFRALFMKDMTGSSYRGALAPEWLSLNMMAAGTFPVMIFLMMARGMRAMHPTTPQFPAVGSLGVIIGLFVPHPPGPGPRSGHPLAPRLDGAVKSFDLAWRTP